MSNAVDAKCTIQFLGDGTAALAFTGEWELNRQHPKFDSILKELFKLPGKPKKVSLIANDVKVWDSSLVSLVYNISGHCLNEKIAVDFSALPSGLHGLIKLAFAVEPQKPTAPKKREHFFSRIGLSIIKNFESTKEVLNFVGEITLAFTRFVGLKAKVRKVDLLEIIQQAGPNGLPIVGLISLLVGLILAYIGAIQLKQFGAQIYVANLVGIAMAREMGGVMASIIMAGRTGAAFAAQLGTMQVNEEIDALKTAGISPMEFLVLPRMLALIIMNPLLCLYAILAGILGGIIVSVGVLGIPLPLYWDQTINAIKLTDVCIGVVKSGFFGILVALCGCYYGVRCGRSAAAVGEATTSAVVSSIVCIVVADAIFAVLTNLMGL